MPRRAYATAAIAALVFSVSSVHAASADANALYQQGLKALAGDGRAIDLQAGRDLLERAAAAGSVGAMQRLGELYRDGDGGVAKDYAKAFDWFSKEAALPNGARGMIGVAMCYEHGQGVTKDVAQSEEWYKKAAAVAQKGAMAGDLDCMIALAQCYAEGHGIKQDPVQAWNWAIKASERPNPYSYEIMAVMTDRGEGIQASDEGALKQMLKAAQLGSTMAMRGVSLCYAQGSGIERDPKGAVEWAQKAIDRGNSKAMTAMGTYLHNGVGVKRDDEAAKQMFQHAVELGDEEAMGHMGELYLASAADAETALSWFQKGTEAGDPASMFYLGGMYAAGRPVNLDLTQAVNLYRRSSDMGYGPAMNAMGELIRFGRINGTMAEAIRWFRSSANAETPAGMRNLGEILAQQGLGDPLKNDDNDNAKLAESITWVTKAANAGDLLAMVDLGDANLTGVGVPSNGFAASVWYKRAADAGNIPATRKLGIMYSDGYYIAHDTAQADALLKKAAAAGDAPAMAALGTLYENGGGKIEKDLNTARQWYERAAELKDAGGYRGLAHLYQDVMNPPDLPRAVRYYEQAVALGDPKSMEFLARMLDIGQGVSKSPDNKARAISLMQQAYKLTGSTTARDWLQSRDLPLDPATQPRGNSREGRSGPMTNPAMPGRGR